MDTNERKICWYSALFITLVVNSARLMALRENGVIAHYWQFNIFEYTFQFLYNYFFCITLFIVNISEGNFLAKYRVNKQLTKYYFCNIMIVFAFIIAGTLIHHKLFGDVHKNGVLLRGYIVRFILSTVLVTIFIRIILLIRKSKIKDHANTELKALYLQSQVTLLKAQLNPHFLFNSLSSLSGIVREDPVLAQDYILHLSKIFRNAITNTESELVMVSNELDMVRSYAELIRIRLENAFEINIDISPEIQYAWLPHLSLQPLLENAAKHNSATVKKPLKVSIYGEEQRLVISNNLQSVLFAGENTGTGLANLNERYHLLMEQNIEIIRTDELFIVKLPLIIK